MIGRAVVHLFAMVISGIPFVYYNEMGPNHGMWGGGEGVSLQVVELSLVAQPVLHPVT